MPKLGWDAFVTNHKTGYCVFGTVLIPKQKPGQLTRTGKKAPTPHSILLDVLAKYIQGDWAARKDKSATHAVVADFEDVQTLAAKLGAKQVKSTVQAPCSHVRLQSARTRM